MNNPSWSPTRALPIKAVVERIGRSRASIYEMMDKTSPRFDSTFPRPFKIGIKTLFVEAEIEEYLRKKIAISRVEAAI